MNYKNAYEELKRIYEKLEDKYMHNVPCCNEEDCGLFKENKQLKDRISKAIEYIENKIESDLIPQDISYENGEETEHNYYVNANDLLNLLKEDNKEQNER